MFLDKLHGSLDGLRLNKKYQLENQNNIVFQYQFSMVYPIIM